MSNDSTMLTFSTESLPGFTIGQRISFRLQVSGGTAPYHFWIESGELPEGLNLTSDGRIIGAAQQMGDTTVFFSVHDRESARATQAYDAQVLSA